MSATRITPHPGHLIIRSGGKVSYWQGEYHQSAADCNGVSTADYIHAMHFFLMQARARDVLMIGCGGGTLATMLSRSGVAVTLVDLHKLSFDIARAWFCLPETIACFVSDGIAFLKHTRHRYDAIVLDAFGKDGMPDAFLAGAFFRLAKSRLKQRGGLSYSRFEPQFGHRSVLGLGCG